MVSQTIDRPHYDTNTGEWDGQLPAADILDQVAEVNHPLPMPDNTVLTLLDWALDLDMPPTTKLVLVAFIRAVDWKNGRECRKGLPWLMSKTRLSRKSLCQHVKWLVGHKFIGRKRRRDGTAITWLIQDVEETTLRDVEER